LNFNFELSKFNTQSFQIWLIVVLLIDRCRVLSVKHFKGYFKYIYYIIRLLNINWDNTNHKSKPHHYAIFSVYLGLITIFIYIFFLLLKCSSPLTSNI
jgi:hypothetical protein